eukprot:6177673-Prymnesium_polylepis.1
MCLRPPEAYVSAPSRGVYVCTLPRCMRLRPPEGWVFWVGRAARTRGDAGVVDEGVEGRAFESLRHLRAEKPKSRNGGAVRAITQSNKQSTQSPG